MGGLLKGVSIRSWRQVSVDVSLRSTLNFPIPSRQDLLDQRSQKCHVASFSISHTGTTAPKGLQYEAISMKVPGFLLRRLYVKGSLRATETGFSFELHNSLGSGSVNEMRPLTLDRTPQNR